MTITRIRRWWNSLNGTVNGATRQAAAVMGGAMLTVPPVVGLLASVEGGHYWASVEMSYATIGVLAPLWMIGYAVVGIKNEG